ncbi:MAG: 4-hydroxy-tetrahydrodipicolinate synthase [Clostridiales bacterium]|nr:4-hydroxy-tetrahydrodipicolinate synthase [Clostridiales bacterium]
MDLRPPVFKGIATALVTPFSSDGIDYVSFARLIEFQLRNGVDAFVVCGTTGEAPVMTIEEKKQAIEFTVKQAKGRVPVIAGTGNNDIKTACVLSEYACRAGVNGIMAVTPYYNKTTKKGLVKSYEEIAKCCDKPIIVYNVPSRTGVNITPEQYLELSEIPGITGVKEANGDLSAFAKTVALCRDRLWFYSGSDELLLPFLSLGGSGLISVASNIIPKKLKKLYLAFISGDVKRASEIQKELTPLESLLFCETNPVPVKTALYYMGYCEKQFRLPLTQMEKKNEQKLYAELIKRGLVKSREEKMAL